jgi:hypothetical protein
MTTLGIRNMPSGDTVYIEADDLGSSVVLPHHFHDYPGTLEFGTTSFTNTTKHILLAAPGDSPAVKKTHLVSIQVANKGGSAVLISIYDGTAGSPDVALAFLYCPAGNTVSVNYSIPLPATAGNGIYVAADASSTTVYVSGQGYAA